MREAQWGDVNLSSATIAHWYETCRDACVSWADRLERSAKMGGTTSVVEVDEAMIGHRKHNTGRLVQGTWVLGIVDVHTSELRVIPCPNNRRDAKTLLTLIDENVLPGTTVMADCWKSCNGLTAKGFQHLTVNHSSHFVDPETWANTQKIESSRRALKKRICRGGVPKETLGNHICEYLWQRDVNRRGADLFTEMLGLFKVSESSH